MKAHPLRQQRAAAAHDARDAVAHQRQEFAQHARVDRHVIHALLGLLLDHFEHHVDGQIFGAAHARKRFVNRHGADRHGRSVDDRLANPGNIAAGRKVHHRVGAVMHGAMQLFQFVAHVRSGRGVADVRVDLAVERDADAHRLEVAMVDVGGNDGAAARHFVAHQLRRDFLAHRHVVHFFGDHALARIVHLRKVLAPPFIAAVRFSIHSSRKAIRTSVRARSRCAARRDRLIIAPHLPPGNSSCARNIARAGIDSRHSTSVSTLYRLSAGHSAGIEVSRERNAGSGFRRGFAYAGYFYSCLCTPRHIAIRPGEDVTLNGTVTGFDWGNPHCLVHMDVKGRKATCNTGPWNSPRRSPCLTLAGARTRRCSATCSPPKLTRPGTA